MLSVGSGVDGLGAPNFSVGVVVGLGCMDGFVGWAVGDCVGAVVGSMVGGNV
jgi:hypothetical protein